jgi:cytochrome oxidase assembly protein ShyY1
MYRFLLRPAWIFFHLLVAGAIVLMVNLGFWQLDRLDERRTFNAQVIERTQEPPVELTSILDEIADGSLTTDEAEWLPVSVQGTYLADQVVEFNNSQGGRAGDNVLTALSLDEPSAAGGDTVIVNRGFIPLGFDVPDAPATAVTVVGYVRRTQVRDLGGVTDADDGSALTEIRRIDLDRLALQYPGDLAPVFVQLIGGDPAPTLGDPEPVVLPQLDEGSHLSYAMQWFIFSFAVAVGWVLAVRRSSGQRQSDSDKAAAVSETERATDASPVTTSA